MTYYKSLLSQGHFCILPSPYKGSHSQLSATVVIGLFVSLSSIGIGYQLGLSLTSQQEKLAQNEESKPLLQSGPATVTQETIDFEDEDEDGIPDGDLSAVSAGFLEPCKMVCPLL